MTLPQWVDLVGTVALLGVLIASLVMQRRLNRTQETTRQLLEQRSRALDERERLLEDRDARASGGGGQPPWR